MKEYRVESDLCNPRCFVIQASTPRKAALLGLKQNNSLKGNFETDYELLKLVAYGCYNVEVYDNKEVYRFYVKNK